MPIFRIRGVFDALEDLLDKERVAILGGDFDVLRRMMTEKERLIGAAQRATPTESVARLKQKAERNQNMLKAATQGIRAVCDHLAKGGQPSKPLQTYSRSGQRQAHPERKSSMERRA
ncbi:MAG: hypothetical protein ACU0DI_03620 [Paracoccaceae bacterium]